MKTIIFFFSLTIISSSLFGAFTIEQALINTLTKNAQKNIEPLPENIQIIYKNFLTEYSDGIMAYMISTENNAKLWDADPGDFLDNYMIVKELMRMEDYEKYTDEFVLSYIIKTTVSHEKLTNYRKVFSDLGLLDYVTKYPDIEERIREINLWCRENLMFLSTSSRTQDPLSILEKSNLGRCGEMQVFFVSACRTIGIPARPAWTPRWAHTDNNHAWTEVFVDGRWQYVENAQPDYYLNSTWFSGSVTKALLVLARSSFPDSEDDVIVKSVNNNYVNSTRYYQKTRDVKFQIIDKDGNPADSAFVNIFAFNFSMFLSLVGIQADSLGIASINISRGGFLAVAHKDSLFAYINVPYGETSAKFNLILNDKGWKNEDFVFKFPEATGIRKDDPEFFAERKKISEEKYNELIKKIQSQEIPDFAPQDNPDFATVFVNSKNNKQELLNFIRDNDNIKIDFWSNILKIDQKFLWQANQVQWQNIYDTFIELKSSEIADNILPGLLTPSVHYEILPMVRIPLKYKIPTSSDTTKRISELIDMLHSKHKIDGEKGPNGLLSLDKLLEADYLQDFQFRTLCCYVLRANHIPASYSRIPSTITVMSDELWKNYNVVENSFSKPQDKSASLLIPVEFDLVDDSEQPVTINPGNISTTIFKGGIFYINDRQLSYDKKKSKLSGKLEKGDYQIQIGIRESGELTKVKLVSLKLNNQEGIKETLIFKDFKRKWKDMDANYYDFISSFTNEKDKDYIVLIGDYDNEPVQRLASKTRSNIESQKFVWVGKNESAFAISNYITSDKYEDFLQENPELKHRLITFYFDSENDKWTMFEGIWDLLYK